MLENILALSIGAVAGALARYAMTHLSSEMTHHAGFPFGTLAVNVLGCFAVGWILAADQTNDRWRILAATGFCGAFTTFSAFAYESMVYWHEGKVAEFAVNAFLNNALCFIAVAAGEMMRSR